MSKQITLKELNENFEEFKKYVLDRFEKNFKVNAEKELAEPTPCLSSYTEIGTEIDIGELGTIRLLDLNYNGTGKKIWQLTKVYKPGEVSLGLPNNDNKDGYSSANELHKTLNEILEKIPYWVRNQIVDALIPCYNPGKKEIEDYCYSIFLLSATEMCQNRPYLAKEGKPLEYYIKNTPSFERWHWLRSPNLLHSDVWGVVSYYGIVGYYDTYDGYGVAPAFCTD